MRMRAQLDRLPYAVRHLSGVDGVARWDELAPSVDLAAFRRNTGREVMPGEIGAYHAHLEAWRALVESGAEVGMILEDDVVFHADFTDAVAAALRVQQEWDFLKLNRIRAKVPVTQGTLERWRLNAYVGPATGLGAYLIKADLAARLMSALLPITRPIDQELDRIHIHDFRHFGLEPFPSHVDDGGFSTITGEAFTAVHKFPWYRRLPVHGVRATNSFAKLFHLARRGRLLPRRGQLLDGPAAHR